MYVHRKLPVDKEKIPDHHSFWGDRSGRELELERELSFVNPKFRVCSVSVREPHRADSELRIILGGHGVPGLDHEAALVLRPPLRTCFRHPPAGIQRIVGHGHHCH